MALSTYSDFIKYLIHGFDNFWYQLWRESSHFNKSMNSIRSASKPSFIMRVHCLICYTNSVHIDPASEYLVPCIWIEDSPPFIFHFSILFDWFVLTFLFIFFVFFVCIWFLFQLKQVFFNIANFLEKHSGVQTQAKWIAYKLFLLHSD